MDDNHSVPAQTSPNANTPLNLESVPPLSTESTANEGKDTGLLEPASPSVEQTNADGNVQAHVDIKYEARDVALASVKANGHSKKKNVKSAGHHKVDIDEIDQHPTKPKSDYSMLNKFLLASAIVCFTLFLCSITIILVNPQRFYISRAKLNSSSAIYAQSTGDDFDSFEHLINEPCFNLTHRSLDGIVVVLCRRGASVNDILIPYNDTNGLKQYRSVVIKGEKDNDFGAVRFGFDYPPTNLTNMKSQLPGNYPYLNAHTEEWSMYVDKINQQRVRFVYQSAQVIYEISPDNKNEFMMKAIVSTLPGQSLVADITNNIYFNLRSSGNLSSHNLNLSSSTPFDISNRQPIERDRLTQSWPLHQLLHINKYFYVFDRSSIGKTYIATLSENTTRTTMRVFSDRFGVFIDLFNSVSPDKNKNSTAIAQDMHGVRISPRQSPVYKQTFNYGPILIEYPSESVHTTWWQFDYDY